jgi:hypothetical protein
MLSLYLQAGLQAAYKIVEQAAKTSYASSRHTRIEVCKKGSPHWIEDTITHV